MCNIYKKILAGLTLATMAPMAMAGWTSLNFQPFVGVDGVYQMSDYQDRFGENLFTNHFQMAKFFAGTRFLKYFGAEFGIAGTGFKEKSVQIGEGNYILGDFLSVADGTEGHIGKVKTKHYSGMITGYLPIPIDPTCRTELYAGLGATRMHFEHIDILTHVDGVPIPNPVPQFTRTYDNKETVFTATVGLNFKLHENIAVRANASFLNTSKFENLKAQENPTGLRSINMKDTYQFGLGIYGILG